MAGPNKDKAPIKVKILGHPGHPEPKLSGVQTSEGDKFTGSIVVLPAAEAETLILMGRAEEVEEKETDKK